MCPVTIFKNGCNFRYFIPWGTTPVEREIFTMYVIGSIILVIEPFSSLVVQPLKVSASFGFNISCCCYYVGGCHGVKIYAMRISWIKIITTICKCVRNSVAYLIPYMYVSNIFVKIVSNFTFIFNNVVAITKLSR